MSKILKIYSDGGSRGNPGPSASGFVVIDDGKIIHKGSKYLGIKTNNEAEYYGVLIALEWLKKNKKLLLTKDSLKFFLDSELVVRQVTGIYRVKVDKLRRLVITVKKCLDSLNKESAFYSVPREKNKIADFLVNQEIDENVG